jgi:hypothetical protein
MRQERKKKQINFYKAYTRIQNLNDDKNSKVQEGRIETRETEVLRGVARHTRRD